MVACAKLEWLGETDHVRLRAPITSVSEAVTHEKDARRRVPRQASDRAQPQRFAHLGPLQ